MLEKNTHSETQLNIYRSDSNDPKPYNKDSYLIWDVLLIDMLTDQALDTLISKLAPTTNLIYKQLRQYHGRYQ